MIARELPATSPVLARFKLQPYCVALSPRGQMKISKSEKREPIFELDKKFEFLKDNPIAQGICGHNGSENSLSIAVRIPRNTLLDGIANCKLSARNQLKVAVAFNFSRDWPEWRDKTATPKTPAIKRTDTAQEFREKCLKEWGNYAVRSAPGRRETNVRLKAIRTFQPEAANSLLASIEMNVGQAGPDEPWLLSGDLVCLPSPIAGIAELAVKRGRLAFDCGHARAGELKERAGYPGGLKFKRDSGNVILTPFGTTRKPGWVVQADQYIGPLSLPHDFCSVGDIAVGEIIDIHFSIYVKDLELVDEEDDEPKAKGYPENESYSFIWPGFPQLGVAKQKILKRIAEMQLAGGEEGWAVLARDSRRFDAADEDGDKRE